MFEKELDRAKKQVVTLLSASEQFVTLQSILSNDRLHKAYKTFFGAEAGWWVYEERQYRTGNPRFDVTDAGQRETLAKLDELYVRTARFNAEHLNSTIDGATKTRLNFLCRPRTTLKWFVYRGEPTKPLNEINLRLDFLHDYQYLTDGIRDWIREKVSQGGSKADLLSVVEFEKIVTDLDNDAILDLSQAEFVELLDPIFEFFEENNPDLLPETVPTEAVVIFLDDKGAIPLSQALEQELYNSELKYLTRKRFLEIVDRVIAEIEASGVVPGQPAVQPAPEPQVAQAPNPETIGLETTEPESIEPESIEPESVEPLPGQVLEPVEADSAVVESRISHLHTLIDKAHREKMTKKLFSKDEHLYNELIEGVCRARNWKEAAAELDRGYAKRGIQPNSAMAMELAQALHRVYL